MPSLFSALAAAAGATVDAVFGEGFLLLPTTAPADGAGGRPDVNARPAASSIRPGVPFTGTFVAAGTIMHAHGRSMADSTTRPVVSEKPMIEVAVAHLPYRPQQGDRVRRDDTGELFEVTRFIPADLGRAWIHLAEIRENGEAR